MNGSAQSFIMPSLSLTKTVVDCHKMLVHLTLDPVVEVLRIWNAPTGNPGRHVVVPVPGGGPGNLVRGPGVDVRGGDAGQETLENILLPRDSLRNEAKLVSSWKLH